ncbi:hypothetical protein RUM44_010392 [Polyplax serrata]|uniref:C2H2-type domain-containing protein n=1 Tax=Polyplax serrata TaxID=468196 RepID=A0ABR1AVE0_POLSC
MDMQYFRRDIEEEEEGPFTSKVSELLKTKVKLDNGEDGYVFTLFTDENPRGKFRCHVCNVPIGSSKSLEEHVSGKNHTRRMQANFHSHENFSKIVIKETSKLCTDVGGKVIKAPGVDIPDLAPGEPVPPGFEDIVTRVPEITTTLDAMKAPLIGLEYLAEITPTGDESEPKYCCLLCNKRGDPRTVLAHLVCFNHRIKYIGRYFPRTNTALALIPKVKEYKRGTGEVLSKIVKAIESKFGRLNPVIVDGAVFDEKKEEYYREMRMGRHFHETADSNYELLVDMDFIKKCAPEADAVLTIDIEKEEAKKRSTALKNEMNKTKTKYAAMEIDKTYDATATVARSMNSKPQREKSVETISSSGSRSYSRSSLYKDEDYISSERPKSTQVKVAELRDRRKKLDLYAEYVEKLEKDMAKTLKGYKKNPEKHPLYPEEWKKFWNRRYKELTAEGIDASKHDFKPEWIKFWLVRMKELHNEELQMKKDKYKVELGLAENDRSSGIDSDVVEVSPTPLEDDKSNVTVEDIKNTWKALTGSDIRSGKEKTSEKSDEYELGTITESEPVRVITVLRLLTALESQLGSLGPRINNLLAQAIALENKKANSSEALLDVSENNVLFETVKEKLKGQLFAGIVEKHMVKATHKAIQNVAELFNAWKNKKNNPEPVTPVAAAAAPAATAVPVVSEPLIVPGIGAVDKVAIAQQIAAALIAQGKTNVTEQELEQLINAVVGMAQTTNRHTPTPPTAAAGLTAATGHPFAVHEVSSLPGLAPAGQPVQKEMDSTQTVLQQLVSSASKPSWVSGTGLKAYDDSSISKKGSFSKDMRDLSEEDMKGMLQNFKDLSSDEQQNLIAYLREMESKDPSSVEKLRKFVGSAGDCGTKTETKVKEDSTSGGRLSPFSMREGGANPFIDDGSKAHSKDVDDDDDDYSYEDIYKAAEKKISGKSVVEKMIEEQQKKVKLPKPNVSPLSDESFSHSHESVPSTCKNSDDPERVLSEAKVMIANIMGQLPSKYNGGAPRNINSKSMSISRSRTTGAGSPSPADYSSQSLYENNSVNSAASKMPNNLLNDYNYQDDIFGYPNDGFQNYSVPAESYVMETNSNDVYNHRQMPADSAYPNTEQSYSGYEPWNESYSHYPPPQQINYSCPPPMMDPNFNGPPFQGSPPNDYNGPSYNNTYREYY